MKPNVADAVPKRKTSDGAVRGVPVLVVDDNPDARAILTMWFQHVGYMVVTAESADEALFLCRLASPHVVLTDIAMPNHDGYWLLRELRAVEENRPRLTPIVAMTAFPTMRDVPLVGTGDFDAWVSKPINFRDLGALMERLMKREAA